MKGWQPGQELDIAREMGASPSAIVGKTLFGSDWDGIADEVSRSLGALMDGFYLIMLPFPDLIEMLPIPTMRRMKAGRKRLDEIIYGLIDERRKSGAHGDDSPFHAVAAQDTEGGQPRHE